MRILKHGVVFACLLALAACDVPTTPSWMGGSPPEIKRAPGERTDVLFNVPRLKADAGAADQAIDVPEQAELKEWHNHNEAMLTPHIGSTGIAHEQTAKIGDGNDFSRDTVSPPIVADGTVFAMDAAGIVSAHDAADIDHVKWVDKTGVADNVYDVLGGGLAFDDGVVYATTGYGNLRAIDAKTGQSKWNVRVGAPVRGAPAIGNGLVVVLTADNQTLAFDITNGSPRWEHRGIKESAGYFSTTAPVIVDGIVVSAYSSGEVFALRAETGNVIWSDTLGNSVKTRASAVFSGIDADPIVQDGVVVVVSASGEMQASALLNGRPLWQLKVGAHNTPWSAGNVLFVLADTHDIAAIFKRDGGIRWAQSMAVADANDPNKDKTPPLYGPILAGNVVMVVDHNGQLQTFKPDTGERLRTFELARHIVTSPIIAGGAMYVVTKNATLHKYY